MKNSKLIIVILSVIVLLVGAVMGVKFLRGNSSESQTEQLNKKIEPVNQIPVTERPFAQILPRSDGREVTIIVDQYQTSSEVEYELEYQAGTLLQGAFGTIDFTTENPPVKRNIFLGHVVQAENAVITKM